MYYEKVLKRLFPLASDSKEDWAKGTLVIEIDVKQFSMALDQRQWEEFNEAFGRNDGTLKIKIEVESNGYQDTDERDASGVNAKITLSNVRYPETPK